MPVRYPAKAASWEQYGIDDRPNSIKIGEAKVDANGEWELTFIPQPKMGPVTSGGFLILQPGGSLDLSIVADIGGPGQYRGPSLGVTLAGPGSPCPEVSVPPRPELYLEPEVVPPGQRVTLKGKNFSGASVNASFFRIEDHRGHGPRARVEIPVASDGTFSYSFYPYSIRDERGLPIFVGPEAHTGVGVQDVASNDFVSLTVLPSTQELQMAMAGPSLPLPNGLQARLRFANGPTKVPLQPELAVIRSQSDLVDVAARYEIPQAVVEALPAIDFKTQMAVAALDGDTRENRQVEITSIQPNKDHFTVHAIKWLGNEMASRDDLVMDFMVIPRTDLPFRFAVPVRVSGVHAKAIRAGRPTRHPGAIILERSGKLRTFAGGS